MCVTMVFCHYKTLGVIPFVRYFCCVASISEENQRLVLSSFESLQLSQSYINFYLHWNSFLLLSDHLRF